MSTSERQSSSEVEHEAEDTRAGLASTLDQLRDNLKPQHVMEEVVGNARIGASTLADSIYALAKENPIPAVLIGAGVAMILGLGARSASRGQGSTHYGPSDRLPPPRQLRQPTLYESAKAGLASVADSFGSAAGSAKEAAAGRVNAARDYVADTSSHLSDSIGDLRRQASDTIDNYSATARDTMKNATRNLPRSRKQAASQLSGILEEQPLILAALGVAVGAALGAALPTTETEDQWMGGASSSLRHAAHEAAENELTELKAVASRTADNLKQSASDHGLSADNLNDLVRDVGEHAKTAVHDVGGTIESSKHNG